MCQNTECTKVSKGQQDGEINKKHLFHKKMSNQSTKFKIAIKAQSKDFLTQCHREHKKEFRSLIHLFSIDKSSTIPFFQMVKNKHQGAALSCASSLQRFPTNKISMVVKGNTHLTLNNKNSNCHNILILAIMVDMVSWFFLNFTKITPICQSSSSCSSLVWSQKFFPSKESYFCWNPSVPHYLHCKNSFTFWLQTRVRTKRYWLQTIPIWFLPNQSIFHTPFSLNTFAAS